MADEQRSSGGGGRFVLWIVIVALLGVVWWLASERNEHRFATTVQNGQLVVQRGRFFPTGTADVQADDPQWGKIYGPVALPAGTKPPPDTEYPSQNELDRGLAELWTGWAKEAAKKGDPASMQAAGKLLDRTAQLPGLAPQQLQEIQALRGDLAWDEALADLKQAAGLLDQARRKVEQVRQANGARAMDATSLSPDLADLAHRLDQASQGKASGQAAPPPAPPPAQPQPAPAQSQSAPAQARPAQKP